MKRVFWKLYAEYTINGENHIELFNSYAEYFSATFSPDCEILVFNELY